MDAADGSRNTGVAIGVVSVQFVPVVEPEDVCQGLFGRRRPQQELLGPEHPQVAVEISLVSQEALRSIPQWVVDGSFVQLGQRVCVGSGILGVAGECLQCPCGESSQAVGGKAVQAPVVASSRRTISCSR